MKSGPLPLRWIVVLAGLSAGCGGAPSNGNDNARLRIGPDSPTPSTGRPYTPPAGCHFKYERTPYGGAPLLPVLIDSEASFRSHYHCAEPTGKEVSRESGVDFSRDHIAVFTAAARGTTPKLVLIIPEGDKLIGVFSVKPYCGGTPPPVVQAATAMLVPAEKVTIDSHSFHDPDAKPCPPGVP